MMCGTIDKTLKNKTTKSKQKLIEDPVFINDTIASYRYQCSRIMEVNLGRILGKNERLMQAAGILL